MTTVLTPQRAHLRSHTSALSLELLSVAAVAFAFSNLTKSKRNVADLSAVERRTVINKTPKISRLKQVTQSWQWAVQDTEIM